MSLAGGSSVWMPEKPDSSEITITQQVELWYMSLRPADADRVARAMDRLETLGPGLQKGSTKLIKGSRYHHMKELRPSGSIRVLFAFDEHQRAAMLVGGDKRGNWRGWYHDNIKEADGLYDRHLRNEGRETTWRALRQRRGERSVASGR